MVGCGVQAKVLAVGDFGLVTRFGDDDSLAYFSTRRDKAVVFSPDGRAAITYRVELGVGLAGGDPIGDRESWPGAIARRSEMEMFQ